MEDIERVTPEQLSQLRQKFSERVNANNPAFHPNDIERVKTDELWLRRFIAHGEQDVETATNLLYECCQWRKEFGVNELDHTKMDAVLFEKGTLFIRNKDKFGKKLLIFKAKHHTKGTLEMDQLQKFIVYYFERIERESKSDQISIVFDMKDTGWQNMDMDFVRYLITLLKTYYPYFVNYLMIFEMPWLLNAAWKIIKGWLPPKFVDRVKFVDKKSLKDWIDVDNQLAEWGGNDDYTYKFEPEVKKGRTVANGHSPDAKPRKTKLTVDTGAHQEVLNGGFHETAGTPLATSQTPSPAHARAAAAFTQAGAMSTTADHCLAEVDERIQFKPTENDEYSCRLHIQNIAQGGNSIIFKIKTTTPDRYRVRPTIAVIEPGGTAKVPITSQPGISAAQIQRDRFQVQVLILPKDMVNDDSCESVSSSTQSIHNSSLADLNSIFKRLINSSGTGVDTFKVGVSVEPRAGDTGGVSTGPTVSMNEERMRKGLEDLEKKITDSVYKKVQPKMDRIQTLMYIILAILIVVSAVMITLLVKAKGGANPVTCMPSTDGACGSIGNCNSKFMGGIQK